MKHSESRAKWIWQQATCRQVNEYVEFRHVFDLAETGSGELRIAADSNFAAWLNGRFVGTGQFSDFAGVKTFSSMDVGAALCRGRNVLAILAYYCGQDHFSYVQDQPGLWFDLRCGASMIVSDITTQCRTNKAYVQGALARISQQRGFVFSYDARNTDDWIAPDYKPDAGWQPAIVTGCTDVPKARPVGMLNIGPRACHRIIAQGVLKRLAHEATPAKLMQHDFLSARDAHELFVNAGAKDDTAMTQPVRIHCQSGSQEDGVYVVIDCGREECGFIDIELEAPAGAVVDIAVGEHLADLRVRAEVGGRNFAGRYITRNGKSHFVHYAERYAGRYVQMHCTNVRGIITLWYAGLLPADYPVRAHGAFGCCDALSERIYEACRRTLHLCMHERYEDCPWREQALYGEDARTEALVGYYAFGEYDLARASLDLLGRSADSDGFIKICAPIRLDLKIPFATMAWMLAVAEYVRFSGDTRGMAEHIERAGAMLMAHCGNLAGDLLPCPRGRKYWQFYDWADGLSGSIARSDEEALSAERFDAILNFSFIVALDELSAAFELCGSDSLAEKFRSQASATRKAAHRMFWNAARQSYMTYAGQQAIKDHYAEMTQALALLAGVASADEAAILRNQLTQRDNALVPISLGMAIYKYDAILQGSRAYGDKAFAMIGEQWAPMLFAGATTFWETIGGQADFGGAGSLCHGFSTIPAYIYQAYTLGIKPIGPGFSRFGVKPVFGDLAWARGSVPTPAGDIEVSWEKCGGLYAGHLRHPKWLEPVFADTGIVCAWTVTTT